MAAVEGKHHKVAVEGKLFGIGAESYTVGTNDFYMAYAATRKTLVCMDAGHYHPTENVADKISTGLCFMDEFCSTFRGRCVGTAIMWSFWMMPRLPSRRKSSAPMG